MGVGCSSIAALATSGQKYVVNDFLLPGTAYGHTFLGTLTCAGSPAHLEMRKTLIREVILVVCILYNHDLAISRREIRIYKQ